MGVAFALGVIFGVRTGAADSILIGIALVMFLGALAVLSSRTTRTLLLLASGGCLIGLVVGLAHTTSNGVSGQPAEDTSVIGQVVRDPQIIRTGAVADIAMDDNEASNRMVRVLLPTVPPLQRGDTVEIVVASAATGDGSLVVRSARVIEPAGFPHRLRNQVRAYLTGTLVEHVPGSPGSLALGLMIGDDSALSAREEESLRRTGLSHITAVSGWNVTLVTAMLGSVFLALRLRGWRWSLVQLIALGLYVWIVGFDPPVVRAGIMGAVTLGATRLGRPSHSITALTIAAAVMVAFDPGSLSSLSFQLSVLATAALVIAMHITSSLAGSARILLVPIATSALIGVATAPLLAGTFGTLSLLSIPSNILVAPLVPLATVAGIVTVGASPVGPVSSVAGLATWTIARGILDISWALSALPFGHWSGIYPSPVVVSVMYAALALAAALLLPEGRAVVRRYAELSRGDPRSAAIAGATFLAVITASGLLL